MRNTFAQYLYISMLFTMIIPPRESVDVSRVRIETDGGVCASGVLFNPNLN